MTPDAALPATPLDRPLPVELTGSDHGWFTRYRIYPVYSPGWVRGRLRVWSVGLALFAALVALGIAASPLPDVPWGAVLQLAVHLGVPVLLGPPLAGWVRRRGWPAEREWWGLVAAMASMVLLVAAFNHFGAEPAKQWLAERTGAVDADGKRKRMVLAVGVHLTMPDEPDRAGSAPAGPAAAPAAAGASSPAVAPAASPHEWLLNTAVGSLLTLWLAGGLGLSAWRREHRGLAALQRERELQRAQAQRREAELKLSVLAAQVEPHFLFNTLAGVRGAIASDPVRASAMIDRLVDYLRASIPRLRSDGGALATLGGQLDIVRAYLELMAARMPRLQVSVHAAPELLGAPCPPLVLISMAENAVKHGIEPKIGPGRVDVGARRTADGALEISVADDGVGFGPSTAGSGLGLTNINERLQQLYQGRATLVLRSRPEGGVCATLTLPPD